MDVAVVGGGIVGMASAYYLARDGASVTVFEKGSLGNGSTERSVGGIRRQFSTPVNVELSKASLSVWESFESTFGVDIDFRRTGYLFLARDRATADGFESLVEMHNDHGVPTQLLDPDEACEFCPALSVDTFRKATYLETDGFADPHLALQGFAEGARGAGAEIRTHTTVDAIRTHEGAQGSPVVEGVRSGGERLDVDYVVNAAGPWARSVADMADVSLPVAPKRRQVVVVNPEQAVPESAPLTIDLDTGSYFRPEREGAALVGGHFDDEHDPDADPDTFDRSVGMDYTMEALEKASAVAGYFGPETRVKRGWAGLYAVTPDHHPIIEETIPGFISAVGFSGHGFQHAPATGKLVNELVHTGSPALVDISRLGSDRFAGGSLIEERHVA